MSGGKRSYYDPLTLLKKPVKDIEFQYHEVPAVDAENPFNLSIPVSKGWTQKSTRILFVLHQVPTQSLKVEALLPEGSVAYKSLLCTLDAAITYARRCKLDFPTNIDSLGVAAINWNASKVYNKPLAREKTLWPVYTERVRKIIRKLNPTHVMVLGDYPMADLTGMDFLEHWMWERRGWVQRTDWCKSQPYVSHTIDLDSILPGASRGEEGANDDYSDLLFFMSRQIAHCLLGKHPFSLKGIGTEPVYVNTVSKFDAMMQEMSEAKFLGIDLETRNLLSYDNDIYTFQVSWDGKKGYVLPIDHPKTPFGEEGILHIKKGLRRWLYSHNKKHTLVLQNGKFDLRVMMAQFKVPVVHHRIHEITAGECLLDENIHMLSTAGIPGMKRYQRPISPNGKNWTPENLRAILCSYENDWYRSADFTKEDRNLTAFVEPNDENFLRYASMDVTCIWNIARMQLRAADCLQVTMFDDQTRTYKARSFREPFAKHLHGHMGDQVKAIATMELHGSTVDVPYMQDLLGRNSQLLKLLRETEAEFRKDPDAIRVNEELSKSSGGSSSKGLFGGGSKGSGTWVLKNKKAHNIKLLVEHLGLEPIARTKTGEPKIDKNFLAAHQDKHSVVSLLQTMSEISKLYSTYVQGWIKRLLGNSDSKKDYGFRASFKFFDIISGRLSSFNPNHQNIPSRGKLSKVIKRMFRAPEGYVQMRADYSAHEVRGLGILARDTGLMKTFLQGLNLRQKLIAESDKNEVVKIKKRLKREGDVHIVNVYRIFNQWVDKSHILRFLIKEMTFGAVYGLAVDTFATRIRANKIKSLQSEIEANPNDKEKKAELRRVEATEPEDFMKEAEEILEKLWKELAPSKAYLDRVVAQVKEHGYVNAPTGRRRTMYRVFTGVFGVVSSAERRAKNAPIQGFASEISISATQQALQAYDIWLRTEAKQIGWKPKGFPRFTRVVHDASYFEVPYDHALAFSICYQWNATFGISKSWGARYGIDFTVPTEIEVEFSAEESTGHEWDWTAPSLRACLENTIRDQIKLEVLAKEKANDVLKRMMAPVRTKSLRESMFKKWPLLGVEKPAIEAFRDPPVLKDIANDDAT